MQAQIQQL
jgi:hypothetical protein